MPAVRNAYRQVPARAASPVAPPPPPPIRKPDPAMAPGMRLYLWLFDLARAGKPSPTNSEIADFLGYLGPGKGMQLITDLTKLGLIEVERGRTWRRIYIRELELWLEPGGRSNSARKLRRASGGA